MALIFFRHKKDADKCISKFLYLPKYILLFSVHFIFRSDFNNAVIILVGFKTILTGNVCAHFRVCFFGMQSLATIVNNVRDNWTDNFEMPGKSDPISRCMLDSNWMCDCELQSCWKKPQKKL